MRRPNVFALKNSSFNAFLFAEVGAELNGSSLTILSILARLGHDPWAEAARWARLPKADVVDRLVRSMAQMPLCPQALGNAPATAARLVMLLPPPRLPSSGAAVVVRSMPLLWLVIAVLFGALTFGLVLGTFTVSKSPAPVEQPVDRPR